MQVSEEKESLEDVRNKRPGDICKSNRFLHLLAYFYVEETILSIDNKIKN